MSCKKTKERWLNWGMNLKRSSFPFLSAHYFSIDIKGKTLKIHSFFTELIKNLFQLKIKMALTSFFYSPPKI